MTWQIFLSVIFPQPYPALFSVANSFMQLCLSACSHKEVKTKRRKRGGKLREEVNGGGGVGKEEYEEKEKEEKNMRETNGDMTNQEGRKRRKV